MFTYKTIFDEIGLFDENLMSGGDFYWGTLAHNKGFQIDFVNTVIVNHPARKSLQLLVKKERRVGGSQALFLPKSKNLAVNLFDFLKSLVPKVHDLRYIIDKGKSLTVKNKMEIFFLRQYLIYTRNLEKLRVTLGKKANRD
jgi:hypothetical protein